MNPDDLLVVADSLAAGEGPGRPRQIELRRAVSTTYYALFHTLANNCADLLVGPRSPSQTNQAWRQAYRALDHGEVKRKCMQGPGKPILDTHFPRSIRDFARQFVKMQEIRNKADYDPLEPFTRSVVFAIHSGNECSYQRLRECSWQRPPGICRVCSIQTQKGLELPMGIA